MSSIDELSTDDDTDDGYISKNVPKDILDGSKIHPDNNERDARLKISDRIKQTQNEWKGAEISAKSTGKVLHKTFKAVVNKLKNALPTLG